MQIPATIQKQTYFARQDAENTLVQIHNGKILALDVVRCGIVVNTHQQVVSHGFGSAQQFAVTHMKQIKVSIDVNDAIARLHESKKAQF